MHTFLEGILTQYLCMTRKIENMAYSKQALSKYSRPEKKSALHSG